VNIAPILIALLPVIVVLTLASVIESLLPLRRQSRVERGRLRINLSLISINLALGLLLNGVLLAGAAYLNGEGLGLFSYLELTGPTATVAAIVALDLSGYLAHVCMHKNAFLWRVHLVHHIDVAVDATTAYRHHPFESLFRFTFTATMAWGLGVPPEALALYRTLSALNAIVEHANIRVPGLIDQVLVLLWVTPDMHKIHHSRAQADTDSNYANLFSVFDRVFGTFTATTRATDVQYGINGYDDAKLHSLGAALRMPFLRPQILDLDPGAGRRVAP
jgi:sterol desaturase/sphingolipid hydroxylase (fatty acid hydroxylase superfamily)